MKTQLKSENLIILESALFRTTTSIIIGKEYVLLVDPNWLPIELDFIENLIQKIGDKKEKYLLFTHSDYDHIIGYGKFKNYRTIASKNFINNEDKASVLKQIEIFDDQYYIKRDYKIEYPKVDLIIEGDNQELNIGSDKYLFWQAKGHNKDGIITFNVSKGILIAGDYLSNIEFPYIYDSVKNYKETLTVFESIIEEKVVNILVTGHGDYTRNKKEMTNRIAASKKYITALESAVQQQKEFDVATLYTRYKFPIIMDQFHQANVKLAENELSKRC